MQCMRCGSETVSDRCFCEVCRAEMEKYPVQPNTSVVLPQRTVSPTVKKAIRKKVVTAEDMILVLKNRIRFLWILLIAFVILSALLIYPAIQYLQEDHFLPGQNYKSIVSVTSETETTASD